MAQNNINHILNMRPHPLKLTNTSAIPVKEPIYHHYLVLSILPKVHCIKLIVKLYCTSRLIFRPTIFKNNLFLVHPVAKVQRAFS